MATLYFIIFLVATFIYQAFNDAQNEDSLYSTTDKCLCGKPGLSVDKIVGGKEVKAHSYPWMALILRFKGVHCGGSLINDRYILTAAHCITSEYQKSIKVYLGVHYISHAAGGKIPAIKIASFRLHEKYTSRRVYPDIGLIKLKKPVTFTDKIAPICLPNSERDYLRNLVTVTGWGRLREGGSISRKLMHANVTVISNTECKKRNPQLGKLVNNFMMCGEGGNRDACDGDSGGPLQIQSKIANGSGGFWEEIGIVSWGIGCGRPSLPGVYTRVSKLLKWIAKNTKDGIYCKSPG